MQSSASITRSMINSSKGVEVGLVDADVTSGRAQEGGGKKKLPAETPRTCERGDSCTAHTWEFRVVLSCVCTLRVSTTLE